MPVRLEDIAIPVSPVTPSTTAAAALSLFLSDPALFAVPVMARAGDRGPPLGHVTRVRLTEALAGLNGRDVLASRSVVHLMTPDPVLADGATPVALLAKKAADGHTTALTDGVIVTSSACYLGIASPAAILAAVAQENAARAKTLQAASKQIESMRGRIRTLSENKSRFLAFLGHEIRTPLTGILGIADLIESSSGGETRRLARTISDSGQHLERLLTDLLDLSRMDAGKLPVNIAAIDLHQFANELRDLWQPRISAKQLSLRITIAPGAQTRVESDAGRLRQVLHNLISNALKFTSRGEVAVCIATSETGSGLNLTIVVTDSGIGISDADKARLFRAFEQADATSAAAEGGAGLGLAVARGLTKRLGGAISLADNPGGGSVFTVTLPVRRAGPRLAVENTPKPKARRFQLGDILLAEDHEASAFVMQQALLAAGWSVDVVASADVAIARAETKRFQAILTDIHMPGGGGEAVLRAIRTGSGPNRLVPILAVTADVTPERRQACSFIGYTGLIEKPVRPRALIAAIADALIAAAA